MEKACEKIVVLLSTFNGEEYLREQLDSLLQQTIKVDILVRDDGSTDSTKQILKEYANKHSFFTWYTGENLKPAHSFFDLVMTVSQDYDYAFFCDQDDIWLSDKIETAVNMLDDKTCIPAMYYSATKLVDFKLDEIGYNFRKSSFSKSLLISFLHGSLVTGCTICINQRLLRKLKLYKPLKMSMHDTWVHRLCLSLGGEIVADPVPHILYRQHSKNVLGLQKQKNYDILKAFFAACPIHLNMASQILQAYGNAHDFPKNNRLFLSDFINYRKSLHSYVRFLSNILFAHIEIKSKLIIIMKVLLLRY